MTLLLVLEYSALLALLGCSAFFSSAETAMFSLNPIHVHRLQRRHPPAGSIAESLLAKPTHLLSTILVGNTLVNVAASALGFALAENAVPGHGELVAIPSMTLLLLIFGEVAPKRLAMTRAEQLAALYARPLELLVRVLSPTRVALEAATSFFQRSIRSHRRPLSEDEFRTVVEVGEEEGVLDEEERTMVDGIIRLEETEARNVMTPRVDIIGIDLDDPPEACQRIAREARFRYLPMYRGSLDHPEGFLDVPRYLLAPQPDLAAAMVAPFFVPETAPLDRLLATFQKEGRRVAFVADEYGGTAGLITRGDILEEIAADVDNEYGDRHIPIQHVAGSRWLVNGNTSIEDINYELDLDLQDEGADRIAGWIIAQAGHIPRTGETVEAQGCRATVERIRKRRILLALLERLPQQPGDGGEEEDPL